MKILLKPEYYLQPVQALTRSFLGRQAILTDLSGLPLSTFPGDYLERALSRTGVYDLALTELIWQLSIAGGLQVDVGANVGYVSRLMQLKASASGVTVSFEPNPDVLPLLERNRAATPYSTSWTIVSKAAGETPGHLPLHRPANYAANHGIARLMTGVFPDADTVEVVTLDDYFSGEKQEIQLLKIDVEGFELQVLKGAHTLMQAGSIRHIVFEDFDPWPGPAPQLLMDYGYSIYAIRKGWSGVRLWAPEKASPHARWEEPNYLATKISAAEIKGIERKGYTCLQEVKRAGSTKGK